MRAAVAQLRAVAFPLLSVVSRSAVLPVAVQRGMLAFVEESHLVCCLSIPRTIPRASDPTVS